MVTVQTGFIHCEEFAVENSHGSLTVLPATAVLMPNTASPNVHMYTNNTIIIIKANHKLTATN